jgi:hypothetical protein
MFSLGDEASFVGGAMVSAPPTNDLSIPIEVGMSEDAMMLARRHVFAGIALLLVACGGRTGLDDYAMIPDAETCNPVPAGCQAFPMSACQPDEQGIACGGPGQASYNYSITCRYMGANPGGSEYFCCPSCGM